jgi:uncharacterized damage-inducible protein DinB
MAYAILKHLQYNAWANTRVADILHEVSDPIFEQEYKSSFPSLAKTVAHLWGAETIWLKRMQGESTTFPTADGKTKRELLSALIESSANLVSFVSTKDETFLRKLYAYKNLKGETFEDCYEDTLFHVVNHGTYHRGQIITMLREAGVTNLVSTDLIHYLRTLKK